MEMRHTESLTALLSLKFRLKLSRHRAIAFGMYLGELQFLKDIIRSSVEVFTDRPIIIAHTSPATYEEFARDLPGLTNKVIHISLSRLIQGFFSSQEIALYISSDGLGLDNIYSVYTFHGQPSKGLTFNQNKLEKFDSLFLYGKLQKATLDHYIKNVMEGERPPHIREHEVGYPKSDALINGCYSRTDLFKELEMDENQRTVVYAPAFNEKASLRESGLEIIETLCKIPGVNVVAKLPVDCMQPKEDEYANGGTDWFFEISQLEETYKNFRLYKANQIDPLLNAADILVTCVSSVSFEFLAIKKPVIFLDTPLFFTEYLPRLVPTVNTKGWEKLDFINGGKSMGLVVQTVRELPDAILYTLENYDQVVSELELITKELLFNPGEATRVCIEELEDLLKSGATSLRKKTPSFFSIHRLKNKSRRQVNSLKSRVRGTLERSLIKRGFQLSRIDKGYLNTHTTVIEARKRGLSVCDYLESLNQEPEKVGRRDRIIEKLSRTGILEKVRSVCEIGTGTGMYLEKLISRPGISSYEVYEVNKSWKEYLREEYGKFDSLKIHAADGLSLNKTPTESIDLVHAHAVFVYLPVVNFYDYFRECVRVCKAGGHIFFDIISDAGFDGAVVKKWSDLKHHFPVIIPENLLRDITRQYRLEIIEEFSIIYGGSCSKYFLLKKHD